MDWFRMYGDMPNDPKIGTLSDAEFRTWVELLCMACKSEREGGTGLSIDTVNWALRRNVTETLQKLLDGDLVRFSETGEIVICNWEKRQMQSDSSTDRVRKHRKEKKENQENQEVKEDLEDETLQKRSSNGLEKNREEKNREEKNKKPKATPSALPDWIPQDAWDGFVAMRKAIKKPITDQSLAIKKISYLRDAGHDPRAVLEQSTLNCWQGLFEVKGAFPRASPTSSSPLGKAGQATALAAQRFLEGSDASD